jgi:hypothetical protein
MSQKRERSCANHHQKLTTQRHFKKFFGHYTNSGIKHLEGERDNFTNTNWHLKIIAKQHAKRKLYLKKRGNSIHFEVVSTSTIKKDQTYNLLI